jgi:hypothetical protein
LEETVDYKAILKMTEADVARELYEKRGKGMGLDLGQRKRLLGTILLTDDRLYRDDHLDPVISAPWFNTTHYAEYDGIAGLLSSETPSGLALEMSCLIWLTCSSCHVTLFLL